MLKDLGITTTILLYPNLVSQTINTAHDVQAKSPPPKTMYVELELLTKLVSQEFESFQPRYPTLMKLLHSIMGSKRTIFILVVGVLLMMGNRWKLLDN